MNNPFLPSSPHLAIRFAHKDEAELEAYKTFLIDYAVPMLLVLEEADEEVKRTHTHAIIQTTIKIGTFRKQLKNKFPESIGNTDYSLKQAAKPEAMLRYVAKGKVSTPPIVIYSNYSSDIVTRAHQDYWVQNEELRKNNSPQKSPKSQTWSEKVFEEIKQFPKPEGGWSNKTEHVHKVFQHVMKCMGRTGKKLNVSIIRDIVNGFMNGLIEGKNRADYENQLFCAAYPEGSDYIREYWRS